MTGNVGSAVAWITAVGDQYTKQLQFGHGCRAYADGRDEIPSGTNPHPSGTEAHTAWQAGYDNRADGDYIYETGS